MSAHPQRQGAARSALLLAALVGPSFTFVALPPVLPDIAVAFGGGTAGQGIAQMVGALPFFGLAVGGLFAGWLLVRLEAAGSIALSGAGLVAAGLGGMIGNAASILLASCALIGLMTALATSSLAALTSALVDGKRRDRLVAVQVAVSDVCTVAGGIAAAVLATRFTWHGPFAIFAAYGGFLLLLLAPARVPPLGPPAAGAGLAQIARIAWPAYLGAGFVFLLVSTQATQLPFYLDQLGYHSAGSRAVFTTAAVAAAMCGSVSYALLLGGVSAWRVQAVAVAAALAGFLGLAFWHGAFGIGLAFVFLVGLSSGLTIPTLFAAALRLAPEGLRGHSIGLLNVAIFAGSFVSPVLLSPIAAALGYSTLYTISALLALLVGAVRVVMMRSNPGAAIEREPKVTLHG